MKNLILLLLLACSVCAYSQDTANNDSVRLDKAERSIRQLQKDVKNLQGNLNAEKKRTADLEQQLADVHQELATSHDSLKGLIQTATLTTSDLRADIDSTHVTIAQEKEQFDSDSRSRTIFGIVFAASVLLILFLAFLWLRVRLRHKSE